MTAREMAKWIDRTATTELGGLEVRVRVLDGRVRFGECDVLITPLEGSGEKWVRSYGVRLDPVAVA